MKRSRVRIALLVAIACLITADLQAAEAKLAPCRPYGVAEEVQCGTLEVPEDWRRTDGRTIQLAFTVLPARGAADEPATAPAAAPLYHLVGGPGADTGFAHQIYTGTVPWPIGKAAPTLREGREIVLLDYRGTGRSNALHCPALDAFHRIEPTFPPDEVAACRDRLSKTADLTQYGVADTVRDLEAVRAALGHERISLFGGSYGTSLALAYARQHPKRVDAMVLVGTLPLDNRIPLEHARNAERVFDRLLDDCAADAGCAEAFPELRKRWKTLLQSLDEAPPKIEVPGDGGPREIILRRGPFVESLRSRLAMHKNQREVPWLIHQAAGGNYQPLVQRVTGGAEFFSMGLYLSAQCPTTLRARDQIEKETAGAALGDYRVRAQLAACEAWPEVETPEGWAEPVRVDVPTLLLTGELDHETPPAWGEKVAGALPTARHVVVPNMGHAWMDAQQPCFLGVVGAFLRDPEPEALDADCLQENSAMPWVLGDDS